MRDLVDAVTAVVMLNGGEIVGKTRLQKIFYLLEAMDLGFGIEFDYHIHGPFSAELAFAADDAVALGCLQALERPGFHAVPYTVFRATKCTSDLLEDEDDGARRHALDTMRRYSSVVLELAATAVYLCEHGYRDTFWDEVRVRKPLKANPERLERAKALLNELNLHS